MTVAHLLSCLMASVTAQAPAGALAAQQLRRRAGNVSVTRGDWSLYEDRKRKPGWITTGPNGSTIEFGVTFGKAPRLTLAWALGYEGFGRVAVGYMGTLTAHRGPVVGVAIALHTLR